MKIGGLGLASILGKFPKLSSVVSPLQSPTPISPGRTGLQSLTGTLPKIKSVPSPMDRFLQQIRDKLNPVISPIAEASGPKIGTKLSPALPTRMPTPSAPPKPIKISVPTDGGGMIDLPTGVATSLYKAFDPYGEATNAAQVMHHPMQVSGTPNEIAKGVNTHGNRGENPGFNPTSVNPYNANGTLDTGLLQINSGTFKGMQANPFWNNAMKKRGITSYSQMTNPDLNAEMGKLILMRGNFDPQTGSMTPGPRNYKQWYGAPRKLRWD